MLNEKYPCLESLGSYALVSQNAGDFEHIEVSLLNLWEPLDGISVDRLSDQDLLPCPVTLDESGHHAALAISVS